LAPSGGPRFDARTRPADDSLDDTDLRPAVGYGDSGYGLPGGGRSGSAAVNGTMRFGVPEENAANHTMVVSPGTIVPGFDDPDYDDSRYRQRGRRGDGEPLLQRLLFSRRLIYVLAAVAAVLAAVLLGWFLTTGQGTTVPKVTGWSQGLARKELKGLGLTVRAGAPRHSDFAPGLIVATDPRAGTTVQGHATVTLFLSLGPVRVAVPDVSGQPEQQAISTLKGDGLRVARVQAPSDTVPAGDVISTNPPAGALTPKNQPVTVRVSAGPPLPSFVGAQFAAAAAAAQQGGYQLNQVADAKSTQPQGTITGQSRAAGTPITSGEVVTVNVSNGPPQVSVPDVQGMTADQATSALQQAGFQVQVVQGFGNKVSAYSPTGQAPAGSTISLIVGFGF
ncbi:MAG: PASTA domain-containing protein, partial [Actinomycetota bacterium]|nr:PASTA domain-containing protein [Actinomycetota bacterium]